MRGVGEAVEGVTETRRHGAAKRSQAHTLCMPVKEGHAGPFLQRLDVLGNRAGCDTKLIRRPRETVQPRGGLEGAKSIERWPLWAWWCDGHE